jgi:hypothetical protein
MFTLSRVVAPTIALLVCLFGSTSLRAEYTVLSGMFDGSEPNIAALQSSYCSKGPSGYRQTNFTVSETGNYRLQDAFENMSDVGGVSVHAQVYEGGFDPAAPNLNVKDLTGDGYSNFSKGVAYTLVVQDKCGIQEGAWALVFTGPGAVGSNNVVAVPDFTQGEISANDPTMDSVCGRGVSGYRQSGPIRVSRSGTYYFSQPGEPIGPWVALLIYTAPVNPEDPQANLVPNVLAHTGFKLRAGQDYYFVAQQCSGTKYGEYWYVLAPPAPFRINPGLSGTWYNADTPGQGFFVTFYEKLNQAFLGWFTYADNPAPGDEYGHRWMTAFGPFEGESAQLAIEWTGGGAFDSAQPIPQQRVDGTILLEFDDCSSGQITYGWGLDGSGAGAVSGVIPIQRHTDDTVALCESLYAGPGMPGPL